MSESTVSVASVSGLLASSTATSVKGFHVNRAVEYFYKDSLFFALANREGWGEDNVAVPVPEFYDELQGVWGYKRIETRHLVVPDDENGTITFQNKRFRIVAAADAVAEGARWLYLMSYINYDELPLETYHQVGIVTGLKPADGVNSYALTPDQVSDPGVVEIINNRRGIGREVDMREQICVIIEF